MAMRNILFDNDGTLYPAELEPALLEASLTSMAYYLSQRLKLSINEFYTERSRLFEKYGVKYTIHVFCREYNLPYSELVRYAYDYFEPAACGLQPNLALKELLGKLPFSMSVMTNNTAEFARKVLAVLGVEMQFEKIVGARELSFEQKPGLPAFEKALAITGYDPKKTLFVDNAPENLATAKQLGMKTILINGASVSCGDADFVIEDVCQIDKLFKEGVI